MLLLLLPLPPSLLSPLVLMLERAPSPGGVRAPLSVPTVPSPFPLLCLCLCL